MERVENAIISIKKTIGNNEFKRLLEVILTEKGSNFFNRIILY